ncbi:MAG: hybrid sensor histidine kinase/response regulator [Phenylobacterium zucineum]|nr:MAG: hybrid sensor histidine kinase/response regulator [Phenylobacterium zucineum]
MRVIRGAGATLAGERGLEARIVGVSLLSTVAALLAVFAVYQWRNWSADRDDLAAESMKLAQAVAVAAHAQLTHRELSAGETVRGLVSSSEHAVAVAYATVDGAETRLASPNMKLGDLHTRHVSRPEAYYRGMDLEVHAPHIVDGRHVGTVTLLVDGRELVTARLVNIAIALGLSLLALIGAAGMARSLTRKALEPLRSLADAMDAAAQSRDFSIRVPIRRGDEVGRLTHRFNRLLTALQDYDGNLQGALREVTAARDAAQDANEMKARFLANMGHELRTPLNGVMGMSQALLREPMAQGQRERVQVIMQSGDALLMVLNDLLDLSDLEKGSMRLERQPFDVAGVIGKACETAVLMAEDKGVELEVEVAAGAAGGWMGDAHRLRQLLYNLISNALKFTPSGHVRVLAEAQGDELVLSVADTGVGIAAEALPRLFDSFTQADGAATRAFGGAGVGLSICSRLVELMGGQIAVESAPGRGSVFSVTLPLERAEVASSDAATHAERILGLKVLVAEDNETNQRVVRTVLNALGVDPVIVADGKAAVEAWSAGTWDLVLMDIQMPVRDGVDATREIRRLEAERGLPPTRIVALTANAMPHQVETYMAVGMNGVVAKPIMIDELHAALVSVRAA